MTLLDEQRKEQQAAQLESLRKLYNDKEKFILEAISNAKAKAHTKDVLAYIDAVMHQEDITNLFNTPSDELKKLERAEKWYTDQRFEIPKELKEYRSILEN